MGDDGHGANAGAIVSCDHHHQNRYHDHLLHHASVDEGAAEVTAKRDYRAIYTVLRIDPDFLSLRANAKLYFYTAKMELPTPGIGVCLTHTMAGLCGLDVESTLVAERELIEHGWIRREGAVLWIVNGLEHTPSLSPKDRKHCIYVAQTLKDLPGSNSLKAAFMERYRAWFSEGDYNDVAAVLAAYGDSNFPARWQGDSQPGDSAKAPVKAPVGMTRKGARGSDGRQKDVVSTDPEDTPASRTNRSKGLGRGLEGPSKALPRGSVAIRSKNKKIELEEHLSSISTTQTRARAKAETANGNAGESVDKPEGKSYRPSAARDATHQAVSEVAREAAPDSRQSAKSSATKSTTTKRTNPSEMEATVERPAVVTKATGSLSIVVAANQGLRDNPLIGAGRELIHPIPHTHASSMATATAWLDDGIDADFARATVYALAKSYTPSRAGDTVKTLKYFDQALRTRWAEREAARVAMESPAPEAIFNATDASGDAGEATRAFDALVSYMRQHGDPRRYSAAFYKRLTPRVKAGVSKAGGVVAVYNADSDNVERRIARKAFVRGYVENAQAVAAREASIADATSEGEEGA